MNIIIIENPRTKHSLGMRHLLVKLVVAQSRFVNLRHPSCHVVPMAQLPEAQQTVGPCALAPEPENAVVIDGCWMNLRKTGNESIQMKTNDIFYCCTKKN